MNILGLHFGHDAAAAVIKNGKIICNISRERHSRHKHVVGLTTHEIDTALSEVNMDFKDIDAVSITSTQGYELLTGLIEDFDVTYDRHKDDTAQSSYHEYITRHNIKIDTVLSPTNIHSKVAQNKGEDIFDNIFQTILHPEDAKKIQKGNVKYTKTIDRFIESENWGKLEPLETLQTKNLANILNSTSLKYGFHFPATVTFRGISKPGYLIDHHTGHCASSYYRSPFEDSLIITHDGHHINTGFIAHGKGHEIRILHPHRLQLGLVYVIVATNLGIRLPGKLMGLAPYGKPTFYNPQYAGNPANVSLASGIKLGLGESSANPWQKYCLEVAKAAGYDFKPLGKKEHILERINVDIAASTQKLLEESFAKLMHYSYLMAIKNGIGSQNLCMSGGVMLNCPSNTKLYDESSFEHIFIEPSCTDEGLSVGGALYVYHHLYGNPLLKTKEREKNRSPFTGAKITDDLYEAAIEEFKDKITVEKLDKAEKQAAQDLEQNHIIAWFEGRSEEGPRALCHRSLLSNPIFSDNTDRVNDVKTREKWRPLAPVVLEEDFDLWFDGGPTHSPYMLYTSFVKSDKIPAVTHVDQSARVQTVTKETGGIYKIIKEFKKLTGVSVLMNTSFNGPAEPIIEKPVEALRFLVNSDDLHAVYMNGCKITRKKSKK